MDEKRSASIALRVSESLKETLTTIARHETRSLSQQVEHFVKQSVREYLKDNKDVKIKGISK